MPLAARLYRFWGWLSSLLQRPSNDGSPRAPSPTRTNAEQAAPPTRVRSVHAERPATNWSPSGAGEVLVRGRMELRMWAVGPLLVLATSLGEAEAALVGLLSDQDPAIRRGARDTLDSLRNDRAVAA